MKKMISKKQYFLAYTAVFALLCIMVYGYFWNAGKSFVWCVSEGDGLVQHYTALCYYATYLRDIIRALLFEHKLIIPEWSFSIGYGSPIITTLHYYVIGDPFNLFSILVPTRYMPYFYSFMIIFRMYCAGLAFSLYGSHMIKVKKECDYFPVLAGAIIYVFCLYGISSGIRHPYFINPMVFFPLLLLGVEKIMKRQSPALFMITVAVSACSNFYFFYMLVILTIVYVLARLFFLYGYRRFKEAGYQILRILLYSVVGLGTGMMIFLPVILTVFQDSRFGNGTQLQLIYEMKYYASFLGSFISTKVGGAWCVLGFAAISIPAIVLMFCQAKKYRLLTIGFIGSTVLLMLPAANYALNGFSYAASRWVWAYALLVSYIVMRMWPELFHMTTKHKRSVMALLFGYFCLCLLLTDSKNENIAFSMVCIFGVFALLQSDIKKYWKERAMLLLIIINIGINGFFLSSIQRTDRLDEYADWNEVNSLVFDTFDKAVAKASEDDNTPFFRFCQEDSRNNAALLSGLHSTQYYWSLSNSSIVDANNVFGILEFTHNAYFDLNSRTRLTNLANVKYYTAPSGRDSMFAPYGFIHEGTYKGGDEKYDIYKNRNPLPFGYTYRTVLDSAEFEAMTSVQKEEALSQSAYVEDEKTALPINNVTLTSKKIPYEITCADDNVTYKDNRFIVTKKDALVSLSFDGMEKCETFLEINGLKYQGCHPLAMYEDDSEFDPLNKYSKEDWENLSALEQKRLKYKYRNWQQQRFVNLSVKGIDEDQHSLTERVRLLNPNYTWYAGKEDFTVNLRYSDAKRTKIEIVFPHEGIYSFKELDIECLPMGNYSDDLNRLSKESMKNVKIDVDRITGNIDVESSKLLCLTIPYEKGWRAYVDGKETEIIKTNYMYSGVLLEAGGHEIELIYHTPGFRTGIIISLVSGVILVFLSFKSFRSMKSMKD